MLQEVNVNIKDGALGLSPSETDKICLVMGVSSGGTPNVLTPIASDDALAAIGYGPGPETVKHLVDEGALVYFMALTQSVAGANGQVTASRHGGPLITLTGTSAGNYTVLVKIIVGGAVATATFKVSLDGGATWSSTATSATTYALDGSSVVAVATGLTIGFPAGTYVANEVYWATAATSGSPSAVGISGPVSVTGTPYDTFSVQVKVTLGGAVGTATFKYSLDGGETFSSDIVTASTYPVPTSGLTLTFAAYTYVALDTYTFASTAPYYSTSNVNTAFDALLADPREWGLGYLAGVPAGANEAAKASAIAGVMAAVGTKMAAAQNAFRFARFIVEAADFDDSGAALITAGVAIAQTRLACVAGFGKVLSPLTGRKHTVNYGRVIASKLGKKPIGKDPSQILAEDGTGPLPSALLSLKHDERKTPGLDAARFVTARTYIGETGFFVTNFNLMSSPGSDFKYLQHGQVMDNACKVARGKMLKYLSLDLDLQANGTLDEGQAQTIEEDVDGAVRASLVQAGHASNCFVVVNRTDDVLSTEKLRAKLRVQPKAYPKTIELEVGFTKTVPVAT